MATFLDALINTTKIDLWIIRADKYQIHIEPSSLSILD